MADWQPIETHDGSEAPVMVWPPGCAATFTPADQYGPAAWWQAWGEEIRLSEPPTHWSPIEPPPTD